MQDGAEYVPVQGRYEKILARLPDNAFLRKSFNLATGMVNRVRYRSTSNYWESRYARGGNSGPGSYGRLAAWKAEFLNDFVRDNEVKSVVELGCGDGNQLRLMRYP